MIAREENEHANYKIDLHQISQVDRAGTRQDIIHFIVASVRVRRPLGDPYDVDVGHATFHPRHDAFDLPEGTVELKRIAGIYGKQGSATQ